MTVYFKLEPGAYSHLNQEITEEFKQLLEKYKEIKREHNAHEVPYNPYSGTNQPEFFFSADISFMRKIKMSKLEGNKDFDDIFRYLFNQEKVKFIKDITFAGTSGLDGTSGSSGASGTSGSSGASGLLGEPFECRNRWNSRNSR